MKRLWFVCLAVGDALFLCCVRANAFPVGDLTLTPRLSTLARYDSNVSMSASHAPQSDWITGWAAGLNVELQGREQQLSMDASLAQEHFSRNPGFDNTTHNLVFEYRRDLSKHGRVNFKEFFTRAEEGQTFADQFGGSAGRYSYYLNRTDLAFEQDFTKQLTVNFAYSNEYYDRLDDPALDSFYNAMSTRATCALTSQTALLGVVSYGRRDYAPGGRIDMNDYDAGVRRYLTPRVYIDGLVGLGIILPDGANHRVAPRYSLTLTDELDAKTQGSLGLTRNDSTNFYSNDVFRSWRLIGGLRRSLCRRILADVAVFYGEGRYLDQNIENKFAGVGGKLTYELTNNSSFYFSDNVSSTSTSAGSGDYTRNVLELGITIRF